MEHTITKTDNLPFFEIKLTGIFNLDDLESCYLDMLSHEKWIKGADILWDVTECQLDDLDSNLVRQIAIMTTKYAQERGNGRAAWLVNRDIDFGISRMFELINEKKVVFAFNVFKQRKGAEDWLIATSVS